MVVLNNRPDVLERAPNIVAPQPYWAKQGFWALIVAAVVIATLVLVFINANETAPVLNEPATVQEILPEYEIDTPANAAVLAKAGSALTVIERYAGLDANLDPDTPVWWMPEYEVDTPAVSATGEFLPVHHYFGSSAAELDPSQ